MLDKPKETIDTALSIVSIVFIDKKAASIY